MTQRGKASERFALTSQATPDPDGEPVIIRLWRALKLLLRSYGLRCIRLASDTYPDADRRFSRDFAIRPVKR